MGKAFLQDTFWFLWAKKLRARFQRGCLCVAFLVWVVWLVFYSVSPPRGASSRFQQPCLPWCPRGLRVSLLLPPYNQPHCTEIFHRFGFFLTHSPCYCQAESARGCWRDLVGWEWALNLFNPFFPPLWHNSPTLRAGTPAGRSRARLRALCFGTGVRLTVAQGCSRSRCLWLSGRWSLPGDRTAGTIWLGVCG